MKLTYLRRKDLWALEDQVRPLLQRAIDAGGESVTPDQIIDACCQDNGDGQFRAFGDIVDGRLLSLDIVEFAERSLHGRVIVHAYMAGEDLKRIRDGFDQINAWAAEEGAQSALVATKRSGFGRVLGADHDHRVFVKDLT